MSEWKKISVNVQNIKHETDRALLIAMPHSSDYDGFTFWISKKLVRAGSHEYEAAVSINTDMTFKLKRTSEKTYKVLAEREIGAEEMIEAFGEYRRATMPLKRNSDTRTVTVHTPAKINAVEVEADADLIR